MIEVPVRVEHEPHRPVGDRGDRCEHLRRQRRELIVDDEYCLRPDRQPDIATPAPQDVGAVGELLRHDLNRVEVLRW
jgi:hypothetical protein